MNNHRLYPKQTQQVSSKNRQAYRQKNQGKAFSMTSQKNESLLFKIALAFIFALLLSYMNLSHADEKEDLNKVNLNARVSEEVARDALKISLCVEEKGESREAIANEVTKKVNAIFKAAKNQKGFEVSLELRNTSTVYTGSKDKDIKKTMWRDTANITVKGRKFDEILKFTRDVQQYAAIVDTSFYVSEEKKDEVEKDLRVKLIKEFKNKASLISKGFGAKSYKIINVNFTRNYGGSRPYVLMAKASGANEAQSADAAPAMEANGGNATITLTLNGSIEMEF